jgi:ribonuclease D
VQNELRTPTLIDTDAGLARLSQDLGEQEVYYLDTEFDSVRSGKTLSVIQISAGAEVHLIDALRLKNLEPLKRAIGRPGTQWVLHAGLQDVELLQERLGLRQVPVLFDTQIAWGLTSPEASVSLAYLQYRLLGLRAMKPHQADDWMRRPLPESQLRYAASDVVHLPELHRALADEAERRGRLDAIEQASAEFLLPTVDEASPRPTLSAFRNAWQLDPPAQAALRFLIDWYADLPARERPGLNQKTLLSIASRLPRRSADIARIKGVPERWVRRHGEELSRGIQEAVQSARDEDFVPIDPAPYASWSEIRLDGWLALARAEVSARAEVAPELALPGRVLRAMKEAIEEGGSRLSGLQALEGWRESVLAPEYASLCAGYASLSGDPSGTEPR